MAGSDDAKVCIVSNNDDWSGLYVNGRLAAEGHRVSLHDVFGALTGKRLVNHEFRTCDHGWLYDLGNLPDNLDDVRWPK